MAVTADLRYSIRGLGRSPGLTVALLLTVALGIGSDAAIVGFIRGLLSPNTPLPDGKRVVAIYRHEAEGQYAPLSSGEYLSLKTRAHAFMSLAAVQESQASVAVDDRSQWMPVAGVTTGFFDVLTLSPSLGQLVPAEDPLESPTTGVVISHAVWRDQFQESAGAVGALLAIDGHPCRIVGVAPEDFQGLFLGHPVDVWMPMSDAAVAGLDRAGHMLWVIGHLNSDTSAAHRRVQAVTRDIPLPTPGGASIPGPGATIEVAAYTGMPPDVFSRLTRIDTLLLSAGGLVFLIACASVAGLLLSRASARAPETSLRVALGASRSRLAWQLLADSLVISTCGGAVGGLLAVWTAHVLPALLFAEDAAHLHWSLDILGLAAACVVSVAVMVVCGLAPLFQIRFDHPGSVLSRGVGGLSPAASRVRAGLVVAQMTACCLLLISTGLMLERLQDALRTNLANRIGRPIIATMQASAGYAQQRAGGNYFQRAEDAVASLSSVTATAWVKTLPGGRASHQLVRPEPPHAASREGLLDVALFSPKDPNLVSLSPKAGRLFGGRDEPLACRVAVINARAADEYFDGDAVGETLETDADQRLEIIGVIETRAPTPPGRDRPVVYYYPPQTALPFAESGARRFRFPSQPSAQPGAVVEMNVVSSAYFDVVGSALMAGRVFNQGDTPLACGVAVLNQEAADSYFGGDAVGGAIIDPDGHRVEIIGVVHSVALRTLQRRADPMVYYPVTQHYLNRMTLLIRTPDATPKLLATVRQRLRGIPGSAEPPDVTTLEEHLTKTSLAFERISTTLFGACAVLAIGLSLVGIYGLMADSVLRRRQEIALRLALGARAWTIVRHVVWQGLTPAAAGAIAGIMGALVVARRMAPVSPAPHAPSPWIWVVSPLVLLAIVALGSVVPARRALGIDPWATMRKD